jgi:hypothetical protein
LVKSSEWAQFCEGGWIGGIVAADSRESFACVVINHMGMKWNSPGRLMEAVVTRGWQKFGMDGGKESIESSIGS